ncbi:MAG: filamentous hemagglutinin N-terminal domain-containing protein, partial [Comamonadaceae bacterium]
MFMSPWSPAFSPSPVPSTLRPTALALALGFAALLGLPMLAAAQPKNATAVHGAVQLLPGGKSLTVVTVNGVGTQHSVIDWRSFSVPKGSTTHFLQPSASSTSINRVTGNAPSHLFGTLSSNGRLVLVNPAGIAVGKDGAVDTAGFTASTLALSDADAVAGRMRFSAVRDNKDLKVDGRVLARNGDVVLLGTDVKIEKAGVV